MNMDFNSIRDDLIKHLHGCGQVNNKIFWYDGTIRLLFEIIKFLDPNTVHKTIEQIIEDKEEDKKTNRIEKEIAYNDGWYSGFTYAKDLYKNEKINSQEISTFEYIASSRLKETEDGDSN